ncbi:MAG TPA: histidine triad nucleotide-binding protein [Acidimicrobiales bacterium]|nr:histidine triad nucleotide-binding protein [Acidimicrobiales bacterium]
MTVQPGCIFCRIVAGEAPADIVRSSDHSVAFRDVNPQAPVHVLVVPRRHVDNASSVTHEEAELTADLLVTAREVAEELGVDRTGYRLVMNVGDDALNSVPHLHVHLLGGRQMKWPPG